MIPHTWVYVILSESDTGQVLCAFQQSAYSTFHRDDRFLSAEGQSNSSSSGVKQELARLVA